MRPTAITLRASHHQQWCSLRVAGGVHVMDWHVATFATRTSATSERWCTHLGLAFNTFFTAQRWFVSLLLLPMLLFVSLSAPIRARGRLGIVHAAENRARCQASRDAMRHTGLVVWLYANALCEVTGGNKGWMYFQRPRKGGGDALRRSLGVISAQEV